MDDSPPTTQTFRSEPGGGPANPAVRRFVLLSILAGLAATGILLGREEISRWYQASAANAYEEKRFDDAITAANKALEWKPGDNDLIALRFSARVGNEDFDGCIFDLNQLIETASADDEESGGRDERDIGLLEQKAQIVQRLGRHTEVLSIWDDILDYRRDEFRKRDDDESRYNCAMALNNRAYMVAQAFSATGDEQQFDVAEALEQSRESIELRGFDDDPVMLDTLGYLLLLNGQAEAAVTHLERAVELTKVEQNAERKRMQEATDQRRYQDVLAAFDNQFAVILHHRGEAYAAVGAQEKSEADIQEALRLGYDPAAGIW